MTHDQVTETYWNGELALCRRVRVRVGRALVPSWWCADLEGTERDAVMVLYNGSKFFLDNEDGRGWRKVTEGRGSPRFSHSSLPDSSVVI